MKWATKKRFTRIALLLCVQLSVFFGVIALYYVGTPNPHPLWVERLLSLIMAPASLYLGIWFTRKWSTGPLRL